MDANAVVTYILATVMSIGGIAFAVGQFRRGKKQSAVDAITIAQQEVTVYRARLERVEVEVAALSKEVERLAKENEVLRTVKVDESKVVLALAKVQRDQTDEILKTVREMVK